MLNAFRELLATSVQDEIMSADSEDSFQDGRTDNASFESAEEEYLTTDELFSPAETVFFSQAPEVPQTEISTPTPTAVGIDRITSQTQQSWEGRVRPRTLSNTPTQRACDMSLTRISSDFCNEFQCEDENIQGFRTAGVMFDNPRNSRHLKTQSSPHIGRDVRHDFVHLLNKRNAYLDSNPKLQRSNLSLKRRSQNPTHVRDNIKYEEEGSLLDWTASNATEPHDRQPSWTSSAVSSSDRTDYNLIVHLSNSTADKELNHLRSSLENLPKRACICVPNTNFDNIRCFSSNQDNEGTITDRSSEISSDDLVIEVSRRKQLEPTVVPYSQLESIMQLPGEDEMSGSSAGSGEDRTRQESRRIRVRRQDRERRRQKKQMWLHNPETANFQAILQWHKEIPVETRDNFMFSSWAFSQGIVDEQGISWASPTTRRRERQMRLRAEYECQANETYNPFTDPIRTRSITHYPPYFHDTSSSVLAESSVNIPDRYRHSRTNDAGPRSDAVNMSDLLPSSSDSVSTRIDNEAIVSASTEASNYPSYFLETYHASGTNSIVPIQRRNFYLSIGNELAVDAERFSAQDNITWRYLALFHTNASETGNGSSNLGAMINNLDNLIRYRNVLQGLGRQWAQGLFPAHGVTDNAHPQGRPIVSISAPFSSTQVADNHYLAIINALVQSNNFDRFAITSNGVRPNASHPIDSRSVHSNEMGVFSEETHILSSSYAASNRSHGTISENSNDGGRINVVQYVSPRKIFTPRGNRNIRSESPKLSKYVSSEYESASATSDTSEDLPAHVMKNKDSYGTGNSSDYSDTSNDNDTENHLPPYIGNLSDVRSKGLETNRGAYTLKPIPRITERETKIAETRVEKYGGHGYSVRPGRKDKQQSTETGNFSSPNAVYDIVATSDESGIGASSHGLLAYSNHIDINVSQPQTSLNPNRGDSRIVQLMETPGLYIQRTRRQLAAGLRLLFSPRRDILNKGSLIPASVSEHKVSKPSIFYQFFKTHKRCCRMKTDHFQLRHILSPVNANQIVFVGRNEELGKRSCAMSYNINSQQHRTYHGSDANDMTSLCAKYGLVVSGYFRSLIQMSDLTTGKLVMEKTIATDHQAAEESNVEPAAIEFINFVTIEKPAQESVPLVMTCSNDASCREFTLWGQEKAKYILPWPVNQLSISPDGNYLAITGDDPDVVIVDRRIGGQVALLKGHRHCGFTSAWHPNGLHLATGNQDFTTRIWDMRYTSSSQSKSIEILATNGDAPRAIYYSACGKFLAVAEGEDYVSIWNAQENYSSCQIIDYFGKFSGMGFSPDDSRKLFVGIMDNILGGLMEFHLQGCSGITTIPLMT